MTTTQRSLPMVLAFLAGCAGAQAARLMVPTASAAPPAQRWEYDCREAREQLTDLANQLGQQGWEMVAATSGPWGGGLSTHQTTVWCFKRPLP